MVNPELFANTFPQVNRPARKAPQAPIIYQEDPEVAKLKLFFLKWLSILVGGAAVLLIIWRVILKFI